MGTYTGTFRDPVTGKTAAAIVPINPDTGQPANGASPSAIAATAFTRPADTTAYAANDLVGNSVTAASVVLPVFALAPTVQSQPRVGGVKFRINRFRIYKSGTGVTAATFRLNLFSALVVPTSGDNAPLATPGNASFIGALTNATMRAFADGAMGLGLPETGSAIVGVTGATSVALYGILEALGAYTPASAEVFTLALEADIYEHT